MMDATKSKTIMTSVIFEKLRNKNPAVKWNLACDDWFIKKFKNVKLRRFSSKAMSPLVIGLLSQSVDVVRTLLTAGCRPDGVDFGNDLGLNRSCHPLHLCLILQDHTPYYH